MKKYVKPYTDVIYFNYSENVVASGSGHFDANGKWHKGGNGNKHVDGVNYEGPNNGNGL